MAPILRETCIELEPTSFGVRCIQDHVMSLARKSTTLIGSVDVKLGHVKSHVKLYVIHVKIPGIFSSTNHSESLQCALGNELDVHNSS